MAQPKIPGLELIRPVMPFGSDGSDWIALLVDALGRLQIDANVDNFPADPTTQTTLALCLTALQKIDDLQNALGSQASDLLRVEAKGGDKIWSYQDVYAESTDIASSPAGNPSYDFGAVPNGEIWRVSFVSATNASRPVIIEIACVTGGVYYTFAAETKGGAASWAIWNGDVIMVEDDYLKFTFVGCLATDVLQMRARGYKMQV